MTSPVSDTRTRSRKIKNDPRIDEVIDAGINEGEDIDYLHVAVKAARMIADGKCRGSWSLRVWHRAWRCHGREQGQGHSCGYMAHDSFSVERLVLSNNAQILCMGERVIGRELARRLAREFFNYTFDESWHRPPKVAALCSYEED